MIIVDGINTSVVSGGGNVDVTSTPTTTGQLWSASFNTPFVDLDGVERMVLTKPLDVTNKKIVMIGSSVMLGTGAASLQGWAYQLGTLLATDNWTVYNHSIGGSGTDSVLARFYDDVVPLQPDICLFGLALYNDSYSPSFMNKFDDYVRGMEVLIGLCKKNNIIPIIAGCYPKQNNDANSYKGVLNTYKHFEKFTDVIVFNMLGAVVDVSNGQFIQSPNQCNYDSAHPSDFGHEELFYSINPSSFNTALWWNGWKNNIVRGSWTLGAETSKSHPLEFETPTGEEFHSFTLSMWLDNTTPISSGIIAAFGNDNSDDIFIEVTATGYDINESAITHFSTTTTTTTKHMLTITYSAALEKVEVFINAVSQGSYTEDEFTTISRFVILGHSRRSYASSNATGYQISDDLVLYRTVLDQTEINRLYANDIPKASLEIWSTFGEQVTYEDLPVINHAPTTSEFIVNTPLFTIA